MFSCVYIEVKSMDEISKRRLKSNMEHILNYLLSRQYGVSVKICFKEEQGANGNSSKSRNITEK